MVALVKRLNKGNPLTFEEMDANLDSLDQELSSKVSATTSSIALINAIQNLLGGVSSAGDTLLKLYLLIVTLQNAKVNITDIVDNLTQTDTDKPLSAYQGKLLNDALNTEISERINSTTGSFVNVNADIINEINNRINSDNLLSLRINDILSNNDQTPLNSLTKIVTAFQIADNDLRASINTLSAILNSDLLTEKNRALSAEIALQSSLATEITNRISAINSEVIERNNADFLKINTTDIINNTDSTSINKPLSAYQGKLLNDKIDLEVNTLTDSLTVDITTVKQLINNEIINRIDNDNLEITNRVAADVLINDRIDTVLSNIDPSKLDSLSELVTAFETADSNLLSSIDVLTTISNSLLNQEILDRQQAINNEVISRDAAIASALALLESRIYSIG